MDVRITTVENVLREAGVLTANDDQNTLATKIVNALDREHGERDDDTDDENPSELGDGGDATAPPAEATPAAESPTPAPADDTTPA